MQLFLGEITAYPSLKQNQKNELLLWVDDRSKANVGYWYTFQFNSETLYFKRDRSNHLCGLGDLDKVPIQNRPVS
jgi:hypothetical protein